MRRAEWAARFVAHAAGNLLLGLALGLAVYYAITGIVTLRGQSDLDAAFASAIGDREPAPPASDDLDLDGWESEDFAYWSELEPGGAFGRLVIGRIGLDVAVVKGSAREHLKLGPGWIEYTDLPGRRGNVGIAGHRTTYGAPFRRLDELVTGDEIVLYSPYRAYRYVVSGSQRVTPDRVDVMDSTDDPRLTLSACDPPYSARFRLIVTARLDGVRSYDP